jgi:ADP-ribose pyrophosphatase
MPNPPNETAELVRHEVAYQGYFKVGRYVFRHSLHRGGLSSEISREVFERGQAGAVLPYDPLRDEVVLIRQFRAGSYVAGRHPFTWEAVAGIIEANETAEAMIRREAVEEAGLQIAEVMPIATVMLTPGACSESCQVFLGRIDATHAGGIFGLESEGEDILVKVLPFAEAYGLVERSEVDNAVGVIALQWLALHRDEVRKRWR